VIVMRKEYLSYVAEYTDKLEPYIKRMEEEGCWDLVERKVVPNYSFNKEGLVFRMMVK